MRHELTWKRGVPGAQAGRDIAWGAPAARACWDSGWEGVAEGREQIQPPCAEEFPFHVPGCRSRDGKAFPKTVL